MATTAMKTKMMTRSSASAHFHKASLTRPSAGSRPGEASPAPSVERRVALTVEEEKEMGVSQYGFDARIQSMEAYRAMQCRSSMYRVYPLTETPVYVITMWPRTGTPNTVAGLKTLLSRLFSMRTLTSASFGPSRIV
jgi:hypothetical protein